MNTRTFILTGIVCLLVCTSTLFAGEIIPGQMIVSASTNSLDLSKTSISGIVKVDSIKGANLYLISFPPTVSSNTVSEQLEKMKGVLKFEPNRRIRMPDVRQIGIVQPDVENQGVYTKGSDPDEFYEQTAVETIKLDSAHITATGEDVIVAVIDNGIDTNHPLFESTLTDSMYDFVDDDSSPVEDSGSAYGHGTFVSGLVLLAAPDCEIMPIRAFDEDGNGTYYDVASAIYYAIDNGANVINMSFGSPDTSSVLLDACQEAFEEGIAMVAAAGNDSSSTVLYPAGYPWVTTVNSIDSVDVIASFSNYGSHTDICAPGENLYSSIPGDTLWGIWSGTSFSAALVSGVCALMIDDDPSLTTDPIRYRLRSEAETSLDWGTVYPHDNYYGYGCLDADASVDYEVGEGVYICGDVNADGIVNSDDIYDLTDYVFYGSPTPDPLNSADIDGEIGIDIDDIVFLGNYVAGTGDEPDCSD